MCNGVRRHLAGVVADATKRGGAPAAPASRQGSNAPAASLETMGSAKIGGGGEGEEGMPQYLYLTVYTLIVRIVGCFVLSVVHII